MARYHYTSVEEHPLLSSEKSHNVGTHRIVLWDKIGPGTHPCYHCGRLVTWRPGRSRGDKDALVVDHLDNDSRNNDPDNLVPSCFGCNAHRTPHRRVIHDDELSVTIGKQRLRAVFNECEECGEQYAVALGRVSRRRFCGKRCAGLWNNRQRRDQ